VKVAVLGLPRGGTSAVVGMLRILGLDLPPAQFYPDCRFGEARGLRINSGTTVEHTIYGLSHLPDNVVWKDPAVGAYAHRVPWGEFDEVVRVYRPLDDCISAERRWGHPGVQPSRDREWLAAIETVPAQVVDFDTLRRKPLLALSDLAADLGLPVPSLVQQDATEAFILSTSGYRCPLPSTCCGKQKAPAQ
jgi:hypothetical protein